MVSPSWWIHHLCKSLWFQLLFVVIYVSPSAVTNWPSLTICAHGHTTNLVCALGQKLVLANAQYGLIDAATSCPRDGDVGSDACLRDVTVQLQTLCFGKNSCNISLNSTSFQNTDPCLANGRPFLTFNYTCLPDNLLAELACGAISISGSDLGGLLSSADYPRTFPRRSDICVQTLQLPPEQSLTLNVIDVDMTPGRIVMACGNDIIIGIHHDNVGTCHCQPLRPWQEIHFRGNVTFRLFERSTPSRGVLFEYKVYKRRAQVERAAVVCSTAFTFPGEPENVITLLQYRNISWPNSAMGVSPPPTVSPTTVRTRDHPRTTRITRPPSQTFNTKSRDRATPTYKTATFNENDLFKPTAQSTVIHHYHIHARTIAIAVGASVASSLLIVILAIVIFAACRRDRSKPPPSTEMTPQDSMPDPLDCDFSNDDMDGLDNPTYGILP